MTNKTIYIQCESTTLSEDEIKSIIGSDIMGKIKQTSNPKVYVYTAFHTGKHSPHVSVKGDDYNTYNNVPVVEGTTFNLSQKEVEQGLNMIEIGTRVHEDHTNPFVEMPSLGQVVGKTLKNQNAIICIAGLSKIDKKHSVSVEADVSVNDDNSYNFEKIKSFALLEHTEPAFPGATKMLEIKAESTIQKPTIADVKKAVYELNIHPSQLYKIDDIKTDKEFFPMFNDFEKREKEFTEQHEEYKKYKANSLVEKSRELIKNHIEATKTLTDKQKKYILYRSDKAETIENSEAFISGAIEEYKQLTKAIGIDTETITPSTNDNNPEGVAKTVYNDTEEEANAVFKSTSL